MIRITNGRETLVVTRGAYKDIFKSQGFYETSIETTSADEDVRSVSYGSLSEVTSEIASEDVSVQETDEPEAEEVPEVKSDVELSEIPLSEMTNDQLREYADQLGVSLKGITSKKAVRDKIRSVL